MLDRRPAPSSAYLVSMLDEIDGLVATLRTSRPTSDIVDAVRRDVLRATLRLDGTHVDGDCISDVEHDHPPRPRTPDRPHETVSDPALTDVSGAADAEGSQHGKGSWLTALGSGPHEDDLDDDRWRIREIVGVAAAFDADDLAEMLHNNALEALSALHARLVDGLVDPARIGSPRRSDQAVLDTSVGRVLYFPVDSHEIPEAMAQLARWLATSSAPAVITAGVVHFELLRIHPFEAANGRLARAAARLLLRAGGYDPFRLAQPEVALATAPLDYHDHVAGAMRRRDTTRWLEFWVDIVADGLRRSVLAVTDAVDPAPARALEFIQTRGGARSTEPMAFTLADYRDAVGVDLELARADIAALVARGDVTRVAGTLGLRLVAKPDTT